MKRFMLLVPCVSLCAQDTPKPCPVATPIATETIDGRPTALNASARCCLSDGFYATGDLLYWRASQHALPYAFDLQQGVAYTANTVGITKANWERIDYDWNLGFRAGLGWNTSYDGWDVSFSWTHYHSQSSQSKSATVIPILPPFFFTGIVTVPVLLGGSPLFGIGEAHARWRLHYDTLDLDLASAFYLKKTLSVRPHMGIRGARLAQLMTVRYGASASNAQDFAGPATFRGESDFHGIGPRLGCDISWRFKYGFSLFGITSGSLLYGKIVSKMVQRATLTTTGQSEIAEHSRDHFKELMPTVQLALGLSWGTCFRDDKMYFGLSAAYEANYWWDQVFFNNTHDLFYNSPITLSGLTASAMFAF